MSFTFATCLEVNEELVEQALAPVEDLLTPPPRKRILALLGRMFQVAEPGRGAPRILLVLSRLAGCEWLEGTLVVRLRASGALTRVELLEDDGFSAERLMPVAEINAPIAEFLRAAQARPDRILPLYAESEDEQRLTLRTRKNDIEQIDHVADMRLLEPERETRALAPEQPVIEWSKPMRPRQPSAVAPGAAEPRRPTASAAHLEPETPLAPQQPRPVDLNATTRLSAQQVSEQLARIRLKKQDNQAPPEPPSSASEAAVPLPAPSSQVEAPSESSREGPPTVPRPAFVAAAIAASRPRPSAPQPPPARPSAPRPAAPPPPRPSAPQPVPAAPPPAATRANAVPEATVSSDTPTVIPPPDAAPTPVQPQPLPSAALPRVPSVPEPAPTPRQEIEVPEEAFLKDELDSDW